MREGDVVKLSVVNQVRRRGGERERGRRRGRGGERGGDSPAAFRHNERIMADGPRCKRRKQANPKRSSGKSKLFRNRRWATRAGRR